MRASPTSLFLAGTSQRKQLWSCSHSPTSEGDSDHGLQKLPATDGHMEGKEAHQETTVVHITTDGDYTIFQNLPT